MAPGRLTTCSGRNGERGGSGGGGGLMTGSDCHPDDGSVRVGADSHMH